MLQTQDFDLIFIDDTIIRQQIPISISFATYSISENLITKKHKNVFSVAWKTSIKNNSSEWHLNR